MYFKRDQTITKHSIGLRARHVRLELEQKRRDNLSTEVVWFEAELK